MLKGHQGGDLTPAETKVDYLPFAKDLYEEKSGFKRLHSSEKDDDITQYFKNRYSEGKATEEICLKCSRKFECLSA